MEGPVLVALWEAETGRIWWQWTHRFDTWNMDRTKETFAFRFPDEQVWDAETPEQIERELEAWRAWQSPESHLPLPVILRVGPQGAGGIGSHILMRSMRDVLTTHPDLLEVRTAPTGPLHLSIEVMPDESVVWLSGGGSATLHHEGLSVDPKSVDRAAVAWAADVAMLIADRLAIVGLQAGAARLVSAVVADSSVVLHPEIGVGAVQVLFDAQRSDDAIALLGRLLHCDDAQAALAGVIGLMRASDTLEDRPREKVVTALLSWANANETHGRVGVAAQMTYSAARLLGSHDLGRTLTLYEKAARRDEAYRERDYWQRERAGFLFLSGRFDDAAAGYRIALGLGDTRATPLLADALLFAGAYDEAFRLLQEVVRDDDLTKPEWRLKHRVLEFLRQFVKEDQRRQSEAADAMAADGAERDVLLEALNLDLLCGEALFRLGRLAAAGGERCTEWFVASAVTDVGFAPPWIRALSAAEDTDLFEDIAVCAKRSCGDEIIHSLLHHTDAIDAADELTRIFEQLPPDDERPIELRIVTHGEASYRTLVLDSSPSDG